MGIDSTRTLRKRLSVISSVLAGMEPPFPALEVLQRDVTAAQQWLNDMDMKLTVLDSPHTDMLLGKAQKNSKVEELKVGDVICDLLYDMIRYNR